MPTFLRALLPLAACLVFATAAQAQVNRQDNEVAANASLFQSLNGGPPQLTVAAHYGHLLKDFSLFGTKLDGVQVGGDALFTGALDFSFAIMSIFPSVRYYFAAKDPRITPYAGVGLGLAVFAGGGFTDTSLAYDVNAGAKYFLNPTTAFFVQLDLTGGFTNIGSSELIASAGLSIFF